MNLCLLVQFIYIIYVYSASLSLTRLSHLVKLCFHILRVFRACFAFCWPSHCSFGPPVVHQYSFGLSEVCFTSPLCKVRPPWSPCHSFVIDVRAGDGKVAGAGFVVHLEVGCKLGWVGMRIGDVLGFDRVSQCPNTHSTSCFVAMKQRIRCINNQNPLLRE